MLRFVVPVLLASTISAHAEEQPDWSGSYYCKVTAMAGISRNPTTKQWNSARFNVEDEAQIVTVKKTALQYPEIFGKETTYTISVKDFGDTGKAYNCLYFFSDDSDAENIPVRESGGASCNWFGSTYFFDFKSLKMQTMFRGGYMDGLDESNDTPYVAVAKCDKVG